MKFVQKLGKALMLPVACLPICGILMGLGYAMCPSTMQGGDVTGIVQQIGFFLVKAGGALIDHMALLFAIVKFDLKTPGREDDDDDETKVVLANDDFTTVAKIVLEGVGGKDNVESVDNCITRLRLVIKDYTKVDEKKIKSAGVAGVVRPSQKDVQVIIGTKVQFVADEFKKLCK